MTFPASLNDQITESSADHLFCNSAHEDLTDAETLSQDLTFIGSGKNSGARDLALEVVETRVADKPETWV
jgi:hypothetical protein